MTIFSKSAKARLEAYETTCYACRATLTPEERGAYDVPLCGPCSPCDECYHPSKGHTDALDTPGAIVTCWAEFECGICRAEADSLCDDWHDGFPCRTDPRLVCGCPCDACARYRVCPDEAHTDERHVENLCAASKGRVVA